MRDGPPPLCLSCELYHRGSPHGDDTCDAFPDQIPGEIIDEGGDHRESRNGEQTFILEPGRELLFYEWLDARGEGLE